MFTFCYQVAIGECITKTQEVFKDVFNMKDLATDGSQFDHLFKDGEVFKVGNLSIEVEWVNHPQKILNFLLLGDPYSWSYTGLCLLLHQGRLHFRW